MNEYTQEERKKAAIQVYFREYPSKLIGDKAKKTIQRWVDGDSTNIFVDQSISLTCELNRAVELLRRYGPTMLSSNPKSFRDYSNSVDDFLSRHKETI